MKPTLWTKNFTIITVGTVISAIGGVAMSFAFSFVVYDQSQSTFLAGLFSALSLLPQILLPLIAAPLVDRFARKPLIGGLDCFQGILYLLFGAYLLYKPFDFGIYLLFSLITSCAGSVYQLAYESLYPNLIPKGFSQKGYTVSGMIYPTVMVIVTPIAAFLYEAVGLAVICMGEGFLLLLASAVETQISVCEAPQKSGEDRFSAKEYFGDLKTAYCYLKKEKGLQRIYGYMPITQGLSAGTSILVMAWFRSNPALGIELYSLFTVAEFIGRTIGGTVHYKVEIPAEKRFGISYFVYQLYSVMDGILLLLPYPLMLVNRAVCGFLGINSATLRQSSVQNYVPDKMRAKLNALFNVLMNVSIMGFQMVVGAMGEVFSAPLCMAVCAVGNIILCQWIMYNGREDVKQVYNHKY